MTFWQTVGAVALGYALGREAYNVATVLAVLTAKLVRAWWLR